MNEKEFTLWLKGFMDAFTEDTIPNKTQFDMIKEKLNSINQSPSIPYGGNITTWVTNTTGEVGTSDKQLLND